MLQIFLKIQEIIAFFCALFLMILFRGQPDCGIHAILLSYPVLRNYIQLKTMQAQFKIKLIENKMPIKMSVCSQLTYYFSGNFGPLDYNPQHLDIFKLNLIDYEFFMTSFENLLDIIHLGKLLHIRGWSLCLFDIAFIGKSAFFAL